MCFSTSASFIAGGLLTVIGVATITKIKAPSQILFASLPLIFALQQFIEGFVWIGLSNTEYLSLVPVSTYMYVFFAQVLWPFYVPLSFLTIEKNKNRKIALYILLGIGLSISIYHLYCMFNFAVESRISPYHIQYKMDFALNKFLMVSYLYLTTIILPPFISSQKGTSLIGALLLLSFFLSKFYFEDFIISVWCFFAAIISLLVFQSMRKLEVKHEYI
jgi:hypothetical protein